MWIFDLIMNAVPFWVWLIVIGVALAFTAQFWMPIWLALPRWLKAVILGAGAILAAYGFGRNKGFRDEQARNKARADNATRNRLEVEQDVKRMSPSDVDKRLEQRGDFHD